MARKKHPNEKQSEKIVVYVTPAQKKTAEKKSRKFESISAWAHTHLKNHLV